MNQQDVIDYFDRLAPDWDADTVTDDTLISAILDGAEVTVGKAVLDVACGTGVMIPYCLKRGAEVTGIDISPQMVRLAREKFPHIPILCGDAQKTSFPKHFDCIVIYNAFPHFSDPEGLIAALCDYLAPGGTLTVAHGMSRTHVDARHSGSARPVSLGLMHEDALESLLSKYLTVTVKVADDRMYQLTAKRT